MDKSKPAYRTYFVVSNPAACAPTGVAGGEADRPGFALERAGASLVVRGRGSYIMGVRRPDGSNLALPAGAVSFRPGAPGLYLVTVRSGAGTFTRKTAFF
jgi:hypothetical protein